MKAGSATPDQAAGGAEQADMPAAEMHFNYVRDGEAQAKNSVYHLYNIADEIGRARCDDKAFDGS